MMLDSEDDDGVSKRGITGALFSTCHRINKLATGYLSFEPQSSLDNCLNSLIILANVDLQQIISNTFVFCRIWLIPPIAVYLYGILL